MRYKQYSTNNMAKTENNKMRIIIFLLVVFSALILTMPNVVADEKLVKSDVLKLINEINSAESYEVFYAVFQDDNLVDPSVRADEEVQNALVKLLAKNPAWKRLDVVKDKVKEKLKKEAASAESTANLKTYGSIGGIALVVVLLIVLLVLMKNRYGSWKTLATPGGTSLGQQAAAEITENQEELDALFRRKKDILTEYQNAIEKDDIDEARRLHGNR